MTDDMTTFKSFTSNLPTIVQSSTVIDASKATYTSSVITITSDKVHSDTTNSNSIASSTVSTASTPTITTASIVTKINVIYKYIVNSNFSLQLGILNDTNVMNNVQGLINNSFNLSNFIIKVTKIQILFRTKVISSEYAYNMLVDILFTSIRNDCDIKCIDNSKLKQSSNFSLPLGNGTTVIVYSESGPLLESETTTVKYTIGESSLGLSAKLGMGIGISLIGILLIAEIIFLYWKYGLSNSSRREQYGFVYNR